MAGGVLDKLLGNGGTAAVGVAGKELYGCVNGTGKVHALVLPKAFVLRRNGGVDKIRGHFVIVRPDKLSLFAVKLCIFGIFACVGVFGIDYTRIVKLKGIKVDSFGVVNHSEDYCGKHAADYTAAYYEYRKNGYKGASEKAEKALDRFKPGGQLLFRSAAVFLFCHLSILPLAGIIFWG